MSEKPATLAGALLELQAALPAIAKTETARVETTKGSYTYTFAGLPAVQSVILPRLAELGLCWTTRPTLSNGQFVLAYTMTHVSSGESFSGEYPILLPPNASPQVAGSALSYARRYALCCATNMAPEDDDDAQAASQPAKRAPARRNVKPDNATSDDGPRLISEPQMRNLQRLLNKAGHVKSEDKRSYCAAQVGLDSLDSLTKLTLKQAALCISLLEQAISEPYDEQPS